MIFKKLIILIIILSIIDYIQTIIGIIYYKNILIELNNIYLITIFKILIISIGIFVYIKQQKENKILNIIFLIINIIYLILIIYNSIMLIKYF